MLNTDLMSSVSLETLGAMLVSSILLAECALSETSAPLLAAKAGGAAMPSAACGARSAGNVEGQVAEREAGAQWRWGAKALRRAERMRSRGLSRCVTRARVRYAIRILGQR
jgi:hypothetical protein